jgi:hypothetical protein
MPAVDDDETFFENDHSTRGGSPVHHGAGSRLQMVSLNERDST